MAIDEALVRDVLRVLCRIPIPQGQLVLYALALRSPETGFKSSEVKDLMKLDQAMHRGLMAALTLRINNSPRELPYATKPGLKLLFNQQWDGNENTYTPKPELVEAVRRVPALASFLNRPVADVLGSGPQVVALPEGIDPSPKVPDNGGSIPPPFVEPKSPFHRLLARVADDKLVFPPELLANVLLALQVKRFVILTGISGTGKTKIGQALASQFEAKRREQTLAGENDERTAIVQVYPYMLRRHRMVLPASIASHFGDDKGPGRVRARWPGGTIELATYRRNALACLFKGGLRTWFEETFDEGDKFVVRVEGPQDGPAEGIVFEPPGPAREVRVENLEIVAVRPDWTDHRGLLGHYNPLTKDYVTTRFLRLLLRAEDECRRAQADGRQPTPFFALLDEMNLARVEHYFADFLSALESGDAVQLHDIAEVEEGESETEEGPVPRKLRVPPNVFFIGTVNVDESTYMFSPKVLDRAFAIEFNAVDLRGLSAGIEAGGELDLVRWNGKLDPPRPPTRDDWLWFNGYLDGALAKLLLDTHAVLAAYNRHFGYRVATEVARFVRLASELGENPSDAAWTAMDMAVLEKVLVKLSGTQAELQELVEKLLEIALGGGEDDASLRDRSRWRLDPVESAVRSAKEGEDREPVFPRAAAKLWRMRDRLLRQGFASWVE